jgi:thiol-disulfide isomerase/thioredoxin
VGVALVLLSAGLARGTEPEALLALPVRRGEAAARPLGDVVGRGPAVVSFWASYCAPCQAEVPVLRKAAARWRSEGLRVIGVGVDFDDAARLGRVASAWGIDYETLWVPPESRGGLPKLLPQGLPVALLVGPGGVLLHDRLLTDADLESAVPALLRARPSSETP